MFSEAVVAIDGSKFKTVRNGDRNFTSAKLQRRMEKMESSVNRYLVERDSADREEPAVGAALVISSSIWSRSTVPLGVPRLTRC